MSRTRGLCTALGAFFIAACGSSGSSGGGALDGGGAAGLGAAGGTAGAGGATGGNGGTGGATGGAAGTATDGGGASGRTVSGKIQLVNAPGAAHTSVILADALTFDPKVPTTLPPPGPKASSVTSDFAIENVPDGKYFVLIAWENDGLVLDPDASAGGATLPVVEVAGEDVTLPSVAKVTAALEVVAPDGGKTPGLPLTFEWKDGSSEQHYELELVDASGVVVWANKAIPAVSGPSQVAVTYAGPPLASGSTHQFRVTSVASGGAPITRTEDLRGVFTAP